MIAGGRFTGWLEAHSFLLRKYGWEIILKTHTVSGIPPMSDQVLQTHHDDTKEARARRALQDLGLQIADRWASGFQSRPTQQLVLQKIIDPVVKHVLQTIFPWMVGTAILFLVLLICTVITCYMVLRTTSFSPPQLPASSYIQYLPAAAIAASMTQ